MNQESSAESCLRSSKRYAGKRHGRIFSLLIAVVILALSITHGAMAADAQNTNTPKAEIKKQPVQSGFSVLTQDLEKKGIRTCLKRIDQVTTFLLAGVGQYGASFIIPSGDPNRQLLSASIGAQMKDGNEAYIGASFAPDLGNKCAAVYEAVAFWPVKCSEVANKNFKKFKKISDSSVRGQILDGGPMVRVFLLPAGPGCVSIKKEVVQ